MAIFISHSPAETQALAEAWGRKAEPGLVVGLTGELGAGKTQVVKGLARGLGITARVRSPTFNLVLSYAGGRLPLFHIDLYRLETAQQIAAAGLEEYLHSKGITVVEWAERWAALSEAAGAGRCVTRLSEPRLLSARLEILGETERRITYEDTGA